MTFIQNKFLKYYIGYDKIFDNIEKISTVTPQINIAFNILKYDYNRYQITVALAGVSQDEVCINVSNDLLILDVKEKKKSIQNDFIHKGIRPNIIHQVFQLEQNIVVEDAELSKGMLKINLFKEKVQNRLKRNIEITET